LFFAVILERSEGPPYSVPVAHNHPHHLNLMPATATPADHPLIVLVGPTASGKTALALHLSEALSQTFARPAEVLSCDSVAVYRGLDIGSAKPTPADRARVPHHGLDLYPPNQPCTAGDYARHARSALAQIRSRNALPIVVGGTGLYLRALLEGLAPAPQRDETLRDRQRSSAARHATHPQQHPTQGTWLHRILHRLDPTAAALIHPNDEPKLIRSIEVTLAARQPQTEQWQAGREPLQGFRTLTLGVGNGPSLRTELYDRINLRAAAMFTRGLVEETAALRAQYGEACRPLTSLGYAQAMAELRGELTRPEAIAAAQAGHRHYAKRQLTWFRADPTTHWLPGFGDDPAIQHAALTLAQSHLHS
jgi:tRNA dimethylallyltransferase